MRICLYTERALPSMGGNELVVDALARQFVALGNEVLVLAPQPRHRITLEDDCSVYSVVRHPPFYSTRWFVDWYRWWLAKVHRSHGFDLLHCHGVYPIGYVAVQWAATARLPTVITSHGDLCPFALRLSKPGLRRRYSFALRQTDAVIAISDWVQRQSRHLCPHLNRIERIPNGVDLARFRAPVQRPAGLDGAIRSGQYVLFLGRLIERKGVDLLLDAFAAVADGNRINLVVAGEGRERSALQSRAARLGIGGRTRFVGRVEGDTKTYLLRHALCAVMPSRISETFPLVVLESCASGIPVIGTRIPGLRDMIDPHRTGILVPPDSPGELARALAQLIGEPELARQLGRQARRLVQDLDWSNVARRHLALFEDILACRRRRKTA